MGKIFRCQRLHNFSYEKILNAGIRLLVIILFSVVFIQVNAQIIYQHNFGEDDINTYPYVAIPTIFDSHLSNSIWTNSINNWKSYNGSSGEAIALNNSSGTPVIQLSFEVASGYQISITQFNFWSQRSATGATNWAMKINTISVGSGSIPLNGTATGNTNVLNPVSGLTGTITVEILLSGASEHGTFRLDDFTLIGTVTPIQTSYRSRQSGNWASPSTWEYSTDNVHWNNAINSPSKEDENILIQSGHTVIVNSPVSLDQTTIAGTLQLQTGGTLNINNGDGDDISVAENGVLQITSEDDYAKSVIQTDGADINISANGKIEIGDGSSSTGNGYENFATSESNIWNDGAVFEYNNNGIFQIAGLTYFPKATSTAIPILRITKVNGSIAAGSGNDFHLNGLFELSTDITFSGAGKKYFRNGIRGISTLTTLGSGKIYLVNENAVLDGSSLKLVLSAVMDLAPKTIIPLGANVTISQNNINNGGLLTVNGILDVTNININNAGDLVIINGKYKTKHPGGFSGDYSSIPSKTGNITLNPGCTIELYANDNQSLNARDDFSNLIFSGSGTKTPKGPFEPDGTITIKDNAVFDCSSQNIGDDRTNLTMTGHSRLILGNFGPNPKMTGEYNLSGGVIEFNGSNGTPQNIRKENYQNIEVTGTNVLMSDGNITLNEGGTFTVKDGGTFTINDNTIIGQGNGTETITIEGGGTFKCGNNKGFNGSDITSAPIQSSSIHKNIIKIFLNPNSTVEYSREGDQPITNADGLIYQNLKISGSGNKTAPSDDLIIQGNFLKTSNVAFIHNNGTVIFNGTEEQTYSSASPQMIFNNLTNQNKSGLNINGNLSIYNELLLKENSVFNLNGNVTFLSSKDHTASIGQLDANEKINYYTGEFFVERYINTNSAGGHPKAWQFVSTPAFGETIFDTWQENGNKTISGYGTWITDKTGTANGFDAASAAPSMKYFDVASNRWIGISNTNNYLENERGYMIFVRGDRQSTSLNSPPTPTILRSKGKLYTPESPPPVSIVPAGKFQSVGNPYASTIDFSQITSSNIQSSYTAWDPTLGGDYGLGGFQTISAAVGYQAVPGGSANYNTSNDYRYIQSGQSFFVFNYTTSEGFVQFAENCKVSGNHHLVTRIAEPTNAILFANLVSKNDVVIDGNAVSFSGQFSNEIDANDALKKLGEGENFALKRSGTMLTVEARQEIKPTDTIFYTLKNLAKKEYKLVFVPKKIKAAVNAYLTDKYLHTERQIVFTDTSVINFTVTSEKASSDPGRFFLTFRAKPDPLAVSTFSINAYSKEKKVIVEWTVENENDIKNYELEYSTDGTHFSNIGIVSPGNFDGKYTFVHDHPNAETAYYRIKINKINGGSEYQKVAKVIIPGITSKIQIVPNPIQQRIIKLQFVKQPLGKYLFNLYNAVGQKIFSEKLAYKGGATLSLKTIDDLNAGIYQLEIIKPNSERTLLKIIAL